MRFGNILFLTKFLYSSTNHCYVVQMMKEGAKWELYIPSELAYGDRGAGGLIPGGSVLIFEMGKIFVVGFCDWNRRFRS